MWDRYAPELKVQRTISVPHQQDRVLGFEGRNTVAGDSALVIKEDSAPTDGAYVGVPEEQARRITDAGIDLYIVSSSSVIGVSAEEFREEASLHTFDSWLGKRTTCQAVLAQNFTKWDRQEVDFTT